MDLYPSTIFGWTALVSVTLLVVVQLLKESSATTLAGLPWLWLGRGLLAIATVGLALEVASRLSLL